MAWRDVCNSFQGGVPSRMTEGYQRSLGYQYGTSVDRANLASARDRAYNAYRNNPVARTLVQTETDNVIGDGLNYQPSSDSEEWNREAKDKYYEWLEEASVRGGDIHSGCELQRLLWQQSRIAGDIGWILVNVPATKLNPSYESRIQLVSAENIAAADGGYATPGMYDGIKFNDVGRPISFTVLSQDERGKRQFTEIPSRDFVYLAHLREPNQARGETCFNTIFDLLAHLDRYIDGVSLAAWMATVMGIVFKTNSATRQMSGFSTLTNSQGNQQRAITFENGMVKFIGTDEEVAQVQASQPMQQTPEFIRTMMRQIGQPFDMPLEVFAKDMSTCTFASARIGLLPYYRTCRIKAARFGSRWSRTIRWWLSRENLRPNGDPKKWKTAFPANYWNHELLVNAWDYTDPVSEVQSDMLQIDAGFKSPQMVMNERGRDGAQIMRERREWKKESDGLPEVRSTMSRDVTDAATDGRPDPELERIKAEADAYGVAVRAGVVTPQTDDEKTFREKLALPAMSSEAIEAWSKDKGVRRPITITPPPGQEKTAFGAPAPPQENPDDTSNNDDDAANE